MYHFEYLIIILIISSQYFAISHCDCTIELYKDMDPRFQPVYFIKGKTKKSFSLATQELVKTRNHITIQEGKILIITCPNAVGQQERFYEVDILLVCGKDNKLIVTDGAEKIPPKTPVNKYQCKNETGFYFKQESDKTAKKECKSFGKQYNLYHFGLYANLQQKWLRKYTQEILQFVIKRKITYMWFTLYSVCSSIPGVNPEYTHHTINRKQVLNRQMKSTKYEENDMRNPFLNWLHQLYMFRNFKKEKMWENIYKNHKGKMDSHFNFENHYFIPISLVPEDAMSFSSWRYATHLTSNIVPIWKQVSCTWKNIENMVKKAAIQIESTLDIYTGTFKRLTLPSSSQDRANRRETYMNFNPDKKIWIPALLWKLIYYKEKNEAIIFILQNDPYQTDRPDLKVNYCKNICKKYGWQIDNDVIRLGEAYCCDPVEFFKKNDRYEKFQKNFVIKKILKFPNPEIEKINDISSIAPS